ncbi:hypothetical protein [Brevundimonas sp.]|uniref:hypothetical protein n=1 Tax=Brevundimonas sp. TaxID=1871086 RepID=UPI0037C05564
MNDALDAMEAAADASDQKPGLITVETSVWIDSLSAAQKSMPKTILDDIRIRNIKVAVGSRNATKILTRRGGRRWSAP